MPSLNEQLKYAYLAINQQKLQLARNQLSHIERARGLELIPGFKRETVWEHTISLLDMNTSASGKYSALASSINHDLSIGVILTHDFPEGFTPHGDLDYSIPAHNVSSLRAQREIAEYEAAHHFAEHNGLNPTSRRLLHQGVDEWFALSSIDALWVRALDLIQGTQSVVMRHLPQPFHVERMATQKIYPVVEELAFKLPRKEASLELLDWFDTTMLAAYAKAGWTALPLINELNTHIHSELKGFSI